MFCQKPEPEQIDRNQMIHESLKRKAFLTKYSFYTSFIKFSIINMFYGLKLKPVLKIFLNIVSFP